MVTVRQTACLLVAVSSKHVRSAAVVDNRISTQVAIILFVTQLGETDFTWLVTCHMCYNAGRMTQWRR
jgi:hypothetical protein